MKHLVLIAALLSPFGAAAAEESPKPSIVIAVNAEPNNLDPASAPFAANQRITYSIFDPLIERDYLAEIDNPAAGVTLAPGLAESWKRIDDRTLELRLRKGVKFHNGREMTAEDVAYSFSPERIFGEKAIAPQAKPYIGDLEPVEIIDPYTVRIRSRTPSSILEYQLTVPQAGIVPKDAYAGGADGFKRHPIGTGPIKFVRWTDAESLEFEANADYFGGAPAFDKVTFRIVPEQASRIAGLVTGEFDLITQVTPDQRPVLSRYEDIRIVDAPLQSTQEILFDVRHPVVASAQMRKALSLAIDRELLVKTIFSGATVVPNSWQIPAMGSVFDPARQATKYDPQAAKQLLEDAGYSGETVTLRYPSGYYPNGDAVVQAVANMWNAIGVKTSIASTETIGQITAGGSAASLIAFNYDLPLPEKSVCAYRGAKTWSAKWMPEMKMFYEGCSKIASVFEPEERRALFGTMLDDLEASMPSAMLYLQPQAYAERAGIDFRANPSVQMDLRPRAFTIGARAMQ